MPFSLIEERLARFAARVERGRGGARRDTTSRGRSPLSGGAGSRERVAVHGLDRGHAFEQQVDARAPRLALVALLDPARAAAARRGPRSRAAPSPRRTRAAPPRAGSSTASAALVDRGVELLGDRERGRAGAVDPGRRGRERGAHRRERAGERARPGELTARERGARSRRSRRSTPSRSSAACSVVVGDRIEVDALAARTDRRQEIVGARR